MGARDWPMGGRLLLARFMVRAHRVRVVMETAQVARTLHKSRGGTGRTTSEVARANAGPEGPGRVWLWRSGSIWGILD